MKIIIQTPDFKALKKLITFVENKLGKFDVITNVVQEARVCLKVDKSDTNENKICEIKLVIAGNDLFASRQTESFEESVMMCISALRHQLARSKSEREKQR
jgi:putative sigma-54 modulation protein